MGPSDEEAAAGCGLDMISNTYRENEQSACCRPSRGQKEVECDAETVGSVERLRKRLLLNLSRPLPQDDEYVWSEHAHRENQRSVGYIIKVQ